MKALIIASILNSETVIGYRLLGLPGSNSFTSKDKFEVCNVRANQLLEAMKKHKIDIINAEIKEGEIKGYGGALSRYVKITSEGQKISTDSPLIVVSKLFLEGSNETAGYIVSDYKGKVVMASEDDIVKYVKNFGIANGKLIKNEDGKEFIAQIQDIYIKQYIRAKKNKESSKNEVKLDKSKFRGISIDTMLDGELAALSLEGISENNEFNSKCNFITSHAEDCTDIVSKSGINLNSLVNDTAVYTSSFRKHSIKYDGYFLIPFESSFCGAKYTVLIVVRASQTQKDLQGSHLEFLTILNCGIDEIDSKLRITDKSNNCTFVNDLIDSLKKLSTKETGEITYQVSLEWDISRRLKEGKIKSLENISLTLYKDIFKTGWFVPGRKFRKSLDHTAHVDINIGKYKLITYKLGRDSLNEEAINSLNGLIGYNKDFRYVMFTVVSGAGKGNSTTVNGYFSLVGMNTIVKKLMSIYNKASKDQGNILRGKTKTSNYSILYEFGQNKISESCITYWMVGVGKKSGVTKLLVAKEMLSNGDEASDTYEVLTIRKAKKALIEDEVAGFISNTEMVINEIEQCDSEKEDINRIVKSEKILDITKAREIEIGNYDVKLPGLAGRLLSL